MSEYVLTERNFKRLTHRVNGDTCSHCGKPFKIGDVVISKKVSSVLHRKRYHKKCYQTLWIEVSA